MGSIPKFAQADRVHDALMGIAAKLDALPTRTEFNALSDKVDTLPTRTEFNALSDKVDTLSDKVDTLSDKVETLSEKVETLPTRDDLKPYMTREELQASQAAMMAQLMQYYERMEMRFDQLQAEVRSLR